MPGLGEDLGEISRREARQEPLPTGRTRAGTHTGEGLPSLFAVFTNSPGDFAFAGRRV